MIALLLSALGTPAVWTGTVEVPEQIWTSSSKTTTEDLSVLVACPADGAPHPVVVILHDAPPDAPHLAALAAHLAERGFFAVLPVQPAHEHLSEPTGAASRWGDHTWSILAKLQGLGTPCVAMVGERGMITSVVGHGLGGIAAFEIDRSSSDLRLDLRSIVLVDAIEDPERLEEIRRGANYHIPRDGYGEATPPFVLFIDAPPSACNDQGSGEDHFARLGGVWRARLIIDDGSHCDVFDPPHPSCDARCGASSKARNAQSLQVIARWLTEAIDRVPSAPEGATPRGPSPPETETHPQLNGSLVVGLAISERSPDLWVGFRPEIYFGMSDEHDFGLGPYLEVSGQPSSGLALGGGASLVRGWFAPSVGLLAQHHSGRWAPTLSVGLTVGRRRFNTISAFDQLLGVRVEGRVSLDGAYSKELLVALQVDLIILAALGAF